MEHPEEHETARPARSATLAMIETIEYAVVNMPWRAISVLAWGWAIYQAVRVLSLLQDVVIEHVRMFGGAMADVADRIVMIGVLGVWIGVGAFLAFFVTGLLFLVACRLGRGVVAVIRWCRP